MRKILVTSLLFTISLNSQGRGQTTWKGLEFGMNEKEVAGVLDGTLTERGSISTDSGIRRLELHPSAEIKSEKYVFSFLFRPLLDFDQQNGGLLRVELEFEETKPAPSDSGALSRNLRLTLATQDIQSILRDTYGSPVSETGRCVLDPQELATLLARKGTLDVFKCDKIWKPAAQVVKFSFFFQPGMGKLFMSIEYRPTPKQL